MKNNTEKQYDEVMQECRTLFAQKSKDYGTSWRILRPSSLTDQIFIKAQRLRTLEEKGKAMVEDNIEGEYLGIINYSLIALIQLRLGPDASEHTTELILSLYDEEALATRMLMMAKNHDYGEAWRDMRIETYTDMILMKVLRVREIENNKGKTLVSEGVDANFRDMMNYAIFALIRLNEKKLENI